MLVGGKENLVVTRIGSQKLEALTGKKLGIIHSPIRYVHLVSAGKAPRQEQVWARSLSAVLMYTF